MGSESDANQCAAADEIHRAVSTALKIGFIGFNARIYAPAVGRAGDGGRGTEAESWGEVALGGRGTEAADV